MRNPATRTFALRSRGAEASIGFSAVGSGYYMSLGNKGDARLAPSQVGVFRRECASADTQTVYVQHQAHHVVLSVPPFGVHP